MVCIIAKYANTRVNHVPAWTSFLLIMQTQSIAFFSLSLLNYPCFACESHTPETSLFSTFNTDTRGWEKSSPPPHNSRQLQPYEAVQGIPSFGKPSILLSHGSCMKACDSLALPAHGKCRIPSHIMEQSI